MRIDFFRPALPEKLLLERNFFELYPFDGGGRFIQQEILGSIDDREIAGNILSGGALADYLGDDGEIDFLKYERWATIEKSCWINRLYFVASLARVARMDRDAALAQMVVDILLSFQLRYKPPRGKAAVAELNVRVNQARLRDYNSGNASGHVDYQWYDFQPAARILNCLHAMFFLRDFPNISPEQWLELDDFIRANAEVVCDGEEQLPAEPGNHQALRGLAMLYAARYFEDDRYLREGNRLCNYHAVHDYLPDGMLFDMSPSYHIFEAWIGRDADLLGTLDGNAKAMLRKAHDICAYLRCPNGLSVVLNDGYPLDMSGFLESIARNTAQTARDFHLDSSHLRFLRGENFFAILDGTPCTARYSHWHAGKNAVTLWCDGRAFFVDSGCCSYDDSDFTDWFKQPQAHSTLLINGQGDGRLKGRYEWVATTHTASDRGSAVVLRQTSEQPEWKGVKWSRDIRLQDCAAIIADTVSLPEEHPQRRELEFLFILDPAVECNIHNDDILLENDGVKLRLHGKSSQPIAWRLLPGKVFQDFKVKNSQRLCATLSVPEDTRDVDFELTLERVP